jgi:hypothetical protein
MYVKVERTPVLPAIHFNASVLKCRTISRFGDGDGRRHQLSLSGLIELSAVEVYDLVCKAQCLLAWVVHPH